MLIGSAAIAQIEPTTPDKPSGYTKNYNLRLYNSGSYPGADSLNQNIIDIDYQMQKNWDFAVAGCILAAIALAISIASLKKDYQSSK